MGGGMPPKVEIVSVCRIQADNAVALVILCLVVHCVCAHVAFCVHACVYARGRVCRFYSLAGDSMHSQLLAASPFTALKSLCVRALFVKQGGIRMPGMAPTGLGVTRRTTAQLGQQV